MPATSPVASALFLSHGGGPLPVLGDPGHEEMRTTLRDIASRCARPSAIVVVSAHWEEARPTLLSHPAPALFYDYYGFPEESYALQYPAPGAPALAHTLLRQLRQHGFDATENDERGFDHGLFIPLLLMYPDADIPCTQLSLLGSLDADAHLRLGEALRGALPPGALLIGSGFSFHNMRAFFAPSTDETRRMNQGFEDWLEHTCTDTALNEEDRRQRLQDWAAAPFARYCHPREEHLLPLHVCYGFAGRAADRHVGMSILGKQASAFLWLAKP
ncbi:MAG: class III extradiol ring-cleavage dioxygenase [Gammaproteobacteria bacterium]